MSFKPDAIDRYIDGLERQLAGQTHKVDAAEQTIQKLRKALFCCLEGIGKRDDDLAGVIKEALND